MTNKKCLFTVLFLLAIIVGLICFTHYKIYQANKQIKEVAEYKDSLDRYNKVYYETAIDELKKHNRQLYDSLDASKDRIDFLVQFTSKQEYNTGKIIVRKDTIRNTDTVYVDTLKQARTFEYTNVNPNDTMTYSLKINSLEEPYWYSLNIKTSSKYTIINKEIENGANHIQIGGNNGSQISGVTVFKKNKKTFWSRFSVGPSVTAGYDFTSKQFGVMAGASVTYDLTK